MNFEFEKLKTDAVIISIKNILVQCIKSFHKMVISAVIGALAIALAVFAIDTKSYNSALSNSASGAVELTNEDKVAIEKYRQLKSKFDQMNDYIVDSLYMKLEFTNVHQGTLIYQVISDEEIKYDLANALVSYVNEGNMVASLINEHSEISPQYLQELILAEVVDETENGTSGVVRISVWTDSEEMSLQLVNNISKLVEDYNQLLKSSIGNCSVKKMQEGCAVRYVESIHERQTDFYTEFEKLDEAYRTQASKMTELQMFTVNSLDDEIADTNANVFISKPRINIKYAVVGAIIGIMLVMIYVCVKVILGGKIQTEKEISLRLGIPHLGNQFYLEKSFLDKIILKIIYQKNSYDLEKQTEVLVARISTYLKAKEIKKVAFVGTSKRVMSSKMEDLAKRLEIDGFEMELLGDVLASPDVLYNLGKVENIILVESVGASKIRNVYEEAELCRNTQKEVVGYISIIE